MILTRYNTERPANAMEGGEIYEEAEKIARANGCCWSGHGHGCGGASVQRLLYAR